MRALLLIFILVASRLVSQEELQIARVGGTAPSFTLFLQDNTTKNFVFPHQKKLMLIHVWSHAVPRSKANHAALKSIHDRYKRAYYKTADGFDLVSIAVQTDRNAWKQTIANDSMSAFLNGVTLRDTEDEVCKKYGISNFPYDVLIDEKGTVLALNPGMKELEGMLSERKIFQPVKRTLTGTLAQSVNREEAFKTGKIFLFNSYGDSVSKSVTYSNGKFNLTEVKPNQDFVLRIPGQKDMDPLSPLALYSPEGDYLMSGTAEGQECVFFIPHKLVPRLMDKNTTGPSEQLYVLHNMEFSTSDGFQLSPDDEKELDYLLNILLKIKGLSIEFKVHTDAKLSDVASMDLSTRQAQLIKNYLLKKGVGASRIKAIPRGRSALLKSCSTPAACTEEEHKQNRRVEFVIS